MDVSKVGNAIKALRIKAGYTQQSLAECLDVTDKAVSKWERGLGVPDISLISKLSILLNTDIDNLLEGNVIFLDHKWRGVVLLDDVSIPPDTVLQGKPIVYILLSYFFLTGIRDIDIVIDEAYCDRIIDIVGYCKKMGVNINIYQDRSLVLNRVCDTMLIHGNAFLFGPNTTKYFQRALSREKGITFLALPQTKGHPKDIVSFDSRHSIKESLTMPCTYYKLPIIFYTKESCSRISDLFLFNRDLGYKDTFAEPLGKGMIYSEISSWNDVTDISGFLSFIEKATGDKMYCLEEIAWRRGFISKEQLLEISQNSKFDKEYLENLFHSR